MRLAGGVRGVAGGRLQRVRPLWGRRDRRYSSWSQPLGEVIAGGRQAAQGRLRTAAVRVGLYDQFRGGNKISEERQRIIAVEVEVDVLAVRTR